jgi:hypothetical protein
MRDNALTVLITSACRRRQLIEISGAMPKRWVPESAVITQPRLHHGLGHDPEAL